MELLELKISLRKVAGLALATPALTGGFAPVSAPAASFVMSLNQLSPEGLIDGETHLASRRIERTAPTVTLHAKFGSAVSNQNGAIFCSMIGVADGQ